MKKTNLNHIKRKTLPILKEAGVTRSALFGSYARGENKNESDIDILIDLPQDKSLFDFVDLKLKLQEALGRNVDLVEYISIKPQLKNSILKDQLQIL